jgi:hypothetical protein
MKTIHKRFAEAYDRDKDNLLRAFDNLANQVLIEEMTARRRRLLNISHAAARTAVLSVLNEDLRLAKLPYKRTGRGV